MGYCRSCKEEAEGVGYAWQHRRKSTCHRLLATDRPEPLDGGEQHAWNMLRVITKRLGLAGPSTKKKGKASKDFKKGRGDSPDSRTHLKSLHPSLPPSSGVAVVDPALFKEMKERDEQEKIVVPSTHVRPVKPLPVHQAPQDDNPITMDDTLLAPVAVKPQKPMITIVRPVVKKMPPALTSGVHHQGIHA